MNSVRTLVISEDNVKAALELFMSTMRLTDKDEKVTGFSVQQVYRTTQEFNPVSEYTVTVQKEVSTN